MALDIEIPITELEEEEEQPSKTYALDLDSGRIVGNVDGLEAVKQAIRKAIITARYKCVIYDDDYGSEVDSLIRDNDCTRELLETALPDLIKDALSQDTRVLSCDNFTFEFKDDSAYIEFEVSTVFGDTTIETEVR